MPRRARSSCCSFLLVLPLMLALFLLSGCPGAGRVALPKTMESFYLKNKWIPLPMPDSRFAPGVIFSYDEATKEIRYVSSLKTCEFPDDVIAAVIGESGKLSFEGSSAYEASAVLQIKGVKAGPKFSAVKKTGLTMDSHGPSSLDLFKVEKWLADPKNAKTYPDVCKQGLAKPNIYIVQEAYQVRKGKYTLHDDKGASISVTGLELGPVALEPSASAKASADGALEFDQPLYTAVRRVRRVDGGFESLGQKGQQDADDAILASMEKPKAP